jgi:hypothetical protein
MIRFLLALLAIVTGMGGAQIQVCEADCTWDEFSEPLPFGLGCDELGEVP